MSGNTGLSRKPNVQRSGADHNGLLGNPFREGGVMSPDELIGLGFLVICLLFIIWISPLGYWIHCKIHNKEFKW